MYLKWYAEMLYQWKETAKSIQICKLASQSLALIKMTEQDKKSQNDNNEKSALSDNSDKGGMLYMAKNMIGGGSAF